MAALRLIGDIGGTNARFAVAEDGKYRELRHVAVSKYATLQEALADYLRRCLTASVRRVAHLLSLGRCLRAELSLQT